MENQSTVDARSAPTQPLDQYLSATLSAPVGHYNSTCQLLDHRLSAA